jgi:hypothetical protein
VLNGMREDYNEFETRTQGQPYTIPRGVVEKRIWSKTNYRYIVNNIRNGG